MQSLIAQQRLECSRMFQMGVAAADPYLAVQNAIVLEPERLSFKLEQQMRSGDWPRIHVLAFGKAAPKMAQAALDSLPLPKLVKPGLVVTTYDHVQAIDHFEVLGAGHPLPDKAGWQAAQRLAKRASKAKANELVLVLVSGGGSALLPLPVRSITLAEKIATTDCLLACGANINEINCVRKHLSQLKGGGLAQFANTADLHALILSDVLGDDVSSIASGPTVPDATSFLMAVAILKHYQVWQQVPESVRIYLEQGVKGWQAETPKADANCFKTKSYAIVGSNAISVNALATAAQQLNYQSDIYSRQLCGEAQIAAEKLLDYALSLKSAGIKQKLAILAGGETTVSLGTNPGKGGRNQEFALAFALAAEKKKLDLAWTFLSAGTDGRDGPTDAAGGLVYPTSLTRMRAAGFDPEQMLRQHNAYPCLQASGDLVMTGATGTNVADLQILLLSLDTSTH